jgi:hypothetical protein
MRCTTSPGNRTAPGSNGSLRFTANPHLKHSKPAKPSVDEQIFHYQHDFRVCWRT